MRIATIFALLTTACVAGANAAPRPQIQTLDEQLQKSHSVSAQGSPRHTGPKSTQDWPDYMSASKVSVPDPKKIKYDQMAPAAGKPLDPTAGAGAIPALPLEIRTVGDIRYITGGVGDEEMAQLEMVKQDYNFRLLMTGIGGAYISDATVRVIDKNDRLLLSTDGAGPYLYATLAPGSYKLEVTAPEGGIKTKKVNVPGKGSVRPVMRFTE